MHWIKGLSAFPITPCLTDGRVDTDALQSLLDRLVLAGVDSIGLLGSTGSYAFVTRCPRKAPLPYKPCAPACPMAFPSASASIGTRLRPSLLGVTLGTACWVASIPRPASG